MGPIHVDTAAKLETDGEITCGTISRPTWRDSLIPVRTATKHSGLDHPYVIMTGDLIAPRKEAQQTQTLPAQELGQVPGLTKRRPEL